LNASIGRYFKIVPYTALGYRDANRNLVNKDLPYLRSDHFVAGLEYLPNPTLRITVEGFLKNYANYMVSERTGISLANLGGDYGILGNEKVVGNGNGKSYGFEVFLQQKLLKKLFFTGSYTLFWSKFSGSDGQLIESAWDNRHLVSLLAGYKLPRNWELGVKFRFQGGVPYTPFDTAASRINYALTGTGSLDYTRINTERLTNFSQLDLRIDKKWNFRRTTLDVFIDIQNALSAKSPGNPNYTFARLSDNSGWDTTDGQPLRADGGNAKQIILENADGSLLPSIGVILEF
jgi:hypothetical protein